MRFVDIELQMDNPFIIYRPVHIMEDVSFAIAFINQTRHKNV